MMCQLESCFTRKKDMYTFNIHRPTLSDLYYINASFLPWVVHTAWCIMGMDYIRSSSYAL